MQVNARAGKKPHLTVLHDLASRFGGGATESQVNQNLAVCNVAKIAVLEHELFDGSETDNYSVTGRLRNFPSTAYIAPDT